MIWFGECGRSGLGKSGQVGVGGVIFSLYLVSSGDLVGARHVASVETAGIAAEIGRRNVRHWRVGVVVLADVFVETRVLVPDNQSVEAV